MKDRSAWERLSVAAARTLAGGDEPEKDMSGRTKQQREKYRKKTYHNGVKVETMIRRATGVGLEHWQSARGAGLPFKPTKQEEEVLRREGKAERHKRRRLMRRKQAAEVREKSPEHL